MSARHRFARSDGSIIEVVVTDRHDGDFHIDAPAAELHARRELAMPGRWAVTRQVHGAAIVDARHTSGDPKTAAEADAIITSDDDQPIAVQGADCAPIAFVTNTGPIAVAHAGWRGLAAGVVSAVAREIGARGASIDYAIVGPVIGPECYEFGAVELDQMVDALGDDVRSETADGQPALDMRAAIVAAFAAEDVNDVRFVAGCPACDHPGFSHRSRQETERHALAARILPRSER